MYASDAAELRANGLVHLQQVGNVKAKPLAEFERGEIMIWNFGYISRVVRLITSKHGKVVGVVEQTPDGRIWERKRRATTLTAFSTSASIVKKFEDVPLPE